MKKQKKKIRKRIEIQFYNKRKNDRFIENAVNQRLDKVERILGIVHFRQSNFPVIPVVAVGSLLVLLIGIFI